MAAFTIVYSNFRLQVPFISSSGLQVQFQPWYLFWTIPLLALIANGPIAILIITISFSALLRYLPYLFYGDWSQPGTTVFMQYVTIMPTIIVAAILLVKRAVLSKSQMQK